jgi:hypothetical protein
MSEGVGGVSGKSAASGIGPVRNPKGALAVALVGLVPQIAYLLYFLASAVSFGLIANGTLAGLFKFAFERDLLVIYTVPLLVVAAITAFIPIKGPQDYYGGVVMLAFSLFAFWSSSDLPGMRGFQFGPGTAPRLFAGLMLFLSLGIAGLGLAAGPGLQRYHWRGPIFVTIAILFFALTIRPLGLIITAFATFMIAALGSPEQRWVQTLIVGIAITAFCCFLFPYVLQLSFQMQPRFMLK